MTWARLEDTFPEHPKVASLSDAAFRLQIEAICYCARQLTDGVVSAAVIKKMGSGKALTELVGAGLMEGAGDAYVVHDFLVYNPSREKVLRDRAKRSVAGTAGATQRWGGRSMPRGKDLPGESDSKSHGEPHSKSHGTPHTNRIDNAHAPVPSRPVPDDSLRSSSPGDDDDPPSAVRECRDLLVGFLPGKYQHDDVTFDSAEDLAREGFSQAELVEAKRRFKSDRKNEGRLPFPDSLRPYLREPEKPTPSGMTAEELRQKGAYVTPKINEFGAPSLEEIRAKRAAKAQVSGP